MMEAARPAAAVQGEGAGYTAEEIAAYLQRNVGDALAEGIAATIKAQPEVPPLFLSRWLLRYVEESTRQQAATKASLDTPAACVAPQEPAVTAGAAGAKQADATGLSASSKRALKAFSAVEWVEQETLQELLDHLQDALGATGVYLAKYEEQVARGDGQVMPGLRYVAADRTHDHMLKQCLFEEEGITWDLLQEEELSEDAGQAGQATKDEEDKDDVASLAEDQAESPSKTPEEAEAQDLKHKVLFVEEVMDNPKVRFFGLTRPGSYVAAFVEFSDVASAASILSMYKWMQQKQQREKALAAERERAEAAKANRRESDTGSSEFIGESAADEAQGEEDEEASEENEFPPTSPQLPSTTAKYVLCADSLGQESWCGERAVCSVKRFAQMIAMTIARTQKEAVERQAQEMLDSSLRETVKKILANLQQNYSEKLPALEEQRQAEALQRLEEEQAEGTKQREMLQQEREALLQEKASRRRSQQSAESGEAGNDEITETGSLQADEDAGEEHAEEQQELPPVPALPEEIVLNAAAAHASLECFSNEILIPFRPHFSLGRKYIADNSALVSAAAACALLTGHEPSSLKENQFSKDTRWNWNRLRRLLTPSFVDTMLAFDPKAPRQYTDPASSLHSITELLELEPENEEQPESFIASVLSSWASLALSARRKELLLQRERLRRSALIQQVPPPQLDELDPDFKYLDETEE